MMNYKQSNNNLLKAISCWCLYNYVTFLFDINYYLIDQKYLLIERIVKTFSPASILLSLSSPLLNITAYLLLLAISLGHILLRSNPLSILLQYLLVINLDLMTYPLADSGNDLIHLLLLIILIFRTLSFLIKKEDELAERLLNWGLKTQLITMYLVAGIAKITSPVWMNGTALYYILKSPIFSSAFGREQLSNLPYWLLASLTYFIIFYQLSFPIAVFFKNFKSLYLVIGILIHLSIFLLLGLSSFSLAVIVGYVIFLPVKESSTT